METNNNRPHARSFSIEISVDSDGKTPYAELARRAVAEIQSLETPIVRSLDGGYDVEVIVETGEVRLAPIF